MFKAVYSNALEEMLRNLGKVRCSGIAIILQNFRPIVTCSIKIYPMLDNWCFHVFLHLRERFIIPSHRSNVTIVEFRRLC